MLNADDSLKAIREAARLSPENLPLRRHLADLLLQSGRPEEAEQEYRAALNLSPTDQHLKIGLASAFYQQGKNSEALVVLEDLAKTVEMTARGYLLYARLLLRAGETVRASQA
ncbi:MAG TPA: tetratricopeptide repeat protein, partial [Chloroflexota bacterium]|nr:tetratricopeptide repeat protein [Chloroflexota bacterium]